MEKFLNIPLIERSNKKVIITPVGKKIVARARNILNEQKEIIQMARQYQNPSTGNISIGIIPTIAPYFLPKVMPSLNAFFICSEI